METSRFSLESLIRLVYLPTYSIRADGADHLLGSRRLDRGASEQ